MCGLAGLVTFEPLSVELRSSNCKKIFDVLHHRGPDFQNDYCHENVWLAHLRLSILDTSNAGNQPMLSDDNRFIICFNGEIYNYRELISQYHLYNLKSSSDTEVILLLFQKFGTDCIKLLNGIFAFSIYDKEKNIIFLVRDRLGVKPLYYKSTNKNFFFSSEIKGIRSLDSNEDHFDIASVHEWLYFGNTLGGKTLFQGLQQILPGNYIELDTVNLTFKISEYWSLKNSTEDAFNNNHSLTQKIRDVKSLLEQAVKRQLVSDVPIGLFLSGGIDSSAIAAFGSKHVEGKLATYSAGFEFSKTGSEFENAKQVSNLFGTDHHEFFIKGKDIGELLEKMIYHHDMPFSDAANIPLYLMSNEVKNHTKVILQGDGGDELFGGYQRYQSMSSYSSYHWLAKIAKPAITLMPESILKFRLQRYSNAFSSNSIATTVGLLLTIEDQQNQPSKIFANGFKLKVDDFDPLALYKQKQKHFENRGVCDQLFYLDALINMPDLYLEKVDRSTMAASVEARVPFLDNDLVEYVYSLSYKDKVRNGEKKWLLKESLRGVIPDNILYGPKKGFSVPYEEWLKNSLKNIFFDNLNQFVYKYPDVLNYDYICTLFKLTEKNIQNHSFMLWKILNFIIWSNSNKNLKIE
jgi:asparagine synthase (glutamine-hydrolysing)